MPVAVNLSTHEVRRKNQAAPDAAAWSFQAPPEGDPRYWITDGAEVRVMTLEERDERVAVWQGLKLRELLGAFLQHSESYYPQTQWHALQQEYLLARVEGRTDAQAYLQPWEAFRELSFAEYEGRKQSILAATTHAQVDAVSTNFDALADSAPSVRVSATTARGLST